MAKVSWQYSRNPDWKNTEVILVDEQPPKHLVAVVGAGPAGLFAARQLANDGARVVLLNRDVKPGGLAEYGIYPDKHKMKDGLRQQFRQILAGGEIDYYGNVNLGRTEDLTLAELQGMGFQAVLVTVGAQGTKWLGLPGEDLTGVYHAKDIVYHYNQLPPFSQQNFAIGRRVAVVGVGNVMLDIAHWLIQDRKVDEVIAVARRGPAEVKFTRVELEYVVANLDLAAFDVELARVSPYMLAMGQDPAQPRALVDAALRRAADTQSQSRFRLMFLASPVRMLGDGAGRVCGLEIEENTLVAANGDIRARGLGVYQMVDVDTVIFAIGDRVDESFGLPTQGNEFVKHPDPCYPVEGISYEVFDPLAGRALEGIFVAGWSRQASTGLVGVARKDGTNGAKAVSEYLKDKPHYDPAALERFHARLEQLDKAVVTKDDLTRLEAIERQKAVQLNRENFKFSTNQEMLEAIGLGVISKA